jgi:hypothetical protein
MSCVPSTLTNAACHSSFAYQGAFSLFFPFFSFSGSGPGGGGGVGPAVVVAFGGVYGCFSLSRWFSVSRRSWWPWRCAVVGSLVALAGRLGARGRRGPVAVAVFLPRVLGCRHRGGVFLARRGRCVCLGLGLVVRLRALRAAVCRRRVGRVRARVRAALRCLSVLAGAGAVACTGVGGARLMGALPFAPGLVAVAGSRSLLPAASAVVAAVAGGWVLRGRGCGCARCVRGGRRGSRLGGGYCARGCSCRRARDLVVRGRSGCAAPDALGCAHPGGGGGGLHGVGAAPSLARGGGVGVVAGGLGCGGTRPAGGGVPARLPSRGAPRARSWHLGAGWPGRGLDWRVAVVASAGVI